MASDAVHALDSDTEVPTVADDGKIGRAGMSPVNVLGVGLLASTWIAWISAFWATLDIRNSSTSEGSSRAGV